MSLYVPGWTRNKREHSHFNVGDMDDLALKNLEFLLGVMGYMKLVRTDFAHLTENNTTSHRESKGSAYYLMYKTSKAA